MMGNHHQFHHLIKALLACLLPAHQTNKKLSLVSPFNQTLVGMPMPSADQTLAGAPMLPANQTLAGTPMLTTEKELCLCCPPIQPCALTLTELIWVTHSLKWVMMLFHWCRGHPVAFACFPSKCRERWLQRLQLRRKELTTTHRAPCFSSLLWVLMFWLMLWKQQGIMKAWWSIVKFSLKSRKQQGNQNKRRKWKQKKDKKRVRSLLGFCAPETKAKIQAQRKRGNVLQISQCALQRKNASNAIGDNTDCYGCPGKKELACVVEQQQRFVLNDPNTKCNSMIIKECDYSIKHFLNVFH